MADKCIFCNDASFDSSFPKCKLPSYNLSGRRKYFIVKDELDEAVARKNVLEPTALAVARIRLMIAILSSL